MPEDEDAAGGRGIIRCDARAPYRPPLRRPPLPRAPRRFLPSRASTSMTRVRAPPTHRRAHVRCPLRLPSHAVRRASQASCSSRTSSARSSPPTALCSWEPTCALVPARRTPRRRPRPSPARQRVRGGQGARPSGHLAPPWPPSCTVASRGPLRLRTRAAVGQVANDMASDQFCETTIGYKVPPRRPPRRPPRCPRPQAWVGPLVTFSCLDSVAERRQRCPLPEGFRLPVSQGGYREGHCRC